MQYAPENVKKKKHRARAFRGHETVRGLHVRPQKTKTEREWRRYQHAFTDFYNRELASRAPYVTKNATKILTKIVTKNVTKNMKSGQ